MSTLGSIFFPTGETIGPGGTSVQHYASERKTIQSAVTPTLLMWFFSIFMDMGGASALPLGSAIFTMVSCLWIVASWVFLYGGLRFKMAY